MKLPNRVWVSPGIYFDVKIVKGLHREHGAIGLCVIDDREILIDSKLGSRQRFSVLIHELVHAADFMANKEFRISEKTVLLIEEVLARWLKP